MTKFSESEEDTTIARGLGLNRRSFLAATTGLAAAAVVGAGVGPLAASAAAATTSNGVIVPPGKRGIILYTVRDAISRDPSTTDLPSGFREVLEYLGKVGYKQVEFAGYGQHTNAEGGNVNSAAGAGLLRKWLDDNGLEAEGNHGSVPSTITTATLAQFDAACERAAILGMGHVGTGGDPSGSNYVADWDVVADVWNVLGQRAMSKFGLKLYTHNHYDAYNFLLDSGPSDALGRPTRSSGIRRLEYFLTRTDPANVFLEMDIFWAHVAQHMYQTYRAVDGTTQTNVFQPLKVVQAQPIRYPLFHAKDGTSTGEAPGVGKGYSMVPFGEGVIDYTTFLANTGAKGYHNPMYELDSLTSLGKTSLENAASSYANMAALRG